MNVPAATTPSFRHRRTRPLASPRARGSSFRPGSWWGILLVMALAFPVMACGDDDDPVAVDTLDPALVYGLYDFGTLTFDVDSDVFGEYDILAAMEIGPDTHYLNIANDGTFDLVFRNPSTGGTELSEGTYEMLEDGVRLEFETSAGPGLVLLPQILEMVYDADTGALTHISATTVPLFRLVALAPELEGVPLQDPVPGTITVVFTPR